MASPGDAEPDLDLRLVRYFTVVAGHQHFGRAATALRVAQPSLSRQIRQLEVRLGARLLDRGRQGTRLTEAGKVFLPRAQALLRSAAEATLATRAAEQPRRIIIGYTAGLVITPAVHRLRLRHPHADIQTRHLAWNETYEALLDHRVDAAVTRLPVPGDGLELVDLYAEPRALMVSAGHRLATRAAVTLDDIAGEPIPRFPNAEWNAFWRIDPRPDGGRAPDGPAVETIEDKLEFIAAGQAVAIVPGIPTAAGTRPDLVTIPFPDIEPTRVVLALRSGETGALISAFRRFAQDSLSGD